MLRMLLLIFGVCLGFGLHAQELKPTPAEAKEIQQLIGERLGTTVPQWIAIATACGERERIDEARKGP